METSERHRRVYELFLEARKLPPGEWQAFLDRACAGDAALRAEVEGYLNGSADLDGFLEKPPQAGDVADYICAVDTLSSDPSAGGEIADIGNATFDGYEVVRRLGDPGGQGVVYQAIQKATKRKVAIKVLRQGPHASRTALKRFEREVELVAQLKHPNIIAVLDSGVTAEGWRYCVMDYVRGLPLNQHVRENHLTLEQTLKLFGAVCDAVQYAHYKGVIHRDLKPSNILVDAEGNPKVLDFGLAKQLIGPVETVVSITQEVVGTLPYMSPEQARGNSDHVDTRTDIYALGVILYELLTGRYPYPVVGNMADVLRHITETPPTPPSRQWTPDSGVKRRSTRQLRAGQCPIDDELQTVVLKTLSKERERRYASAADLAEDLRRYLVNDPIEAKRDSRWYVLKKSVVRHKLEYIATGLTVALLVTWGLIIWGNTQRALAGARQAYDVAEQKLADQNELISEAFQAKELGRWEVAREKIEQAVTLGSQENYRAFAYAAWIRKEEYTLNRAFAFRDRSLLRDADQLCDRALALEAGKPGLWNLKAAIRMGLGDFRGAEDACREALAIDGDYFYAESTLAKVLAVQGRLDEALATAEVAVEHVNERNSYADEPWRTLGTLQLYRGQSAALDSLLGAREVNHRDTRTWLLLARLYLTLPGNIDHTQALFAARLADTFRKLEDPRYKRVLAWAELASGLWSDALADAEAALTGGDEPPAYAHFIAAAAAARLGDREAANEHLEQGTSAWPAQFAGSDVVVTVEKEFLWLDTVQELQALRMLAGQAVEEAGR